MYFICKSALDVLPGELDITELDKGAPRHRFRIESRDLISNTIGYLEDVVPLSKYVDRLRASAYAFTALKEPPIADAKEADIARVRYNELIRALQIFTDMYESFDIPERADGIDIKLPDNMTLEQASDILSSIDTIFTKCPLFTRPGDSISFCSVDIGSVWISLAIAGDFLLNRIATFVKKCVDIRQQIAITKQQEESARALKMGNDFVESMMESNKQLISAYTRNIAESLCAENNDLDNETIERTRVALDGLVRLMQSGVEVYSAVTAPKDIKAMFPSSKVQQIDGKKLEMLDKGQAPQDT